MHPFGCGEFIREFLLGNGPNGSPVIDLETGAPQADIFYHYKKALMRATALDRATRVEEKQARREKRSIDPANIEKLAEKYLTRMPYKAQGCRFHSFGVYLDNSEIRLGGTYRTGRAIEFPGALPAWPAAAGISVSLAMAELPLREPGLIPIERSTAKSWPTRPEARNNFLTHKIYKKSEGGSLVHLPFKCCSDVRSNSSSNVHHIVQTSVS